MTFMMFYRIVNIEFVAMDKFLYECRSTEEDQNYVWLISQFWA